MSMQKLRLAGCERYNFKGELYEKGKVYIVGEVKATLLLRDKDEYDRPYFVPYVKPVKSKAQIVAEAAAAAAILAAVEEEIVERPDGSEPQVAEDGPEVEQPTEVDVDMDDDPSLDEEDEPNPNEVVEEEELVSDRSDGSEEEV